MRSPRNMFPAIASADSAMSFGARMRSHSTCTASARRNAKEALGLLANDTAVRATPERHEGSCSPSRWREPWTERLLTPDRLTWCEIDKQENTELISQKVRNVPEYNLQTVLPTVRRRGLSFRERNLTTPPKMLFDGAASLILNQFTLLPAAWANRVNSR